jgi:hypothetical protein
MIGNAVPPRMGNEIAKSIINVLNRSEISEKTLQIIEDIKCAPVLVGYYKGSWHKKLILNNKIYYVRSDGRKGSMFKENCAIIPKYLLLHYKNEGEIYELELEEPILADASFLQTLGFETTGDTYLCFRLKSDEPKNISNIVSTTGHLVFEQSNYSPFFTTIDKITDSKI